MINPRLHSLKSNCEPGKAYSMPYSSILEADLREGEQKNLLIWRREGWRLTFKFFDYINLFEEVQK